jgi:hypothetical protein
VVILACRFHIGSSLPDELVMQWLLYLLAF